MKIIMIILHLANGEVAKIPTQLAIGEFCSDKVEEYREGAYYIDKGKLKRHSKGKLYSVGEKGFLVEQTDI